VSMDPNRYEVSEPELLRGLRLSWRGSFLRDHPWISAFSGTFGIPLRFRLDPPRSNSGAITGTSIVTISSPRDPRFPPRPRSLDPTRSDPDSHLRHPRRLLQDRRQWTKVL